MINIDVPSGHKYNLEISLGGDNAIIVQLKVKHTLRNRFRYWMLCNFFPFEIKRWDDD